MPYELKWQLEGRIIDLHLKGILTTTEGHDASLAITEYIREGEAPVHLIVTMRELLHSPSGIQTNLRITAYLKEPKLGYLITIGGTPFIMVMLQMLRQFINFKSQSVENFADAMSFLREHDPSLEALI
jgi:hypothetical protein